MVYKVTFSPAEPYFFGNEKSFKYPGQKIGGAYSNSYFIRSEDMPSQSGILGTLRFLLLPHIKTDYSYSDDEKRENAEAVGEKSFNIDSEKIQKFGLIKKISPVFITDGKDTYIPAPLNDNSEYNRNTDNKNAKKYIPLADFKQVKTSDGIKLYAADYNTKYGLTSGFLNLADNNIYFDLIESSTRVGINRAADNDGFFKKEYKMLKKGYSFAVYADIEKEMGDSPVPVYMGQGKSPFSVKFEKSENNLENEVKEALGKLNSQHKIIYCLSNAVVSKNPCDNTLFAAYQSSDYRSFMTNFSKSVKKGKLHRLIKAGSIFITDKPNDWIQNHSNKNAEQIGFNKFIIAGGSK